MKKLSVLILTCLFGITCLAHDKPILIIGASMENKSSPFHIDTESPLSGAATNHGNAWDIGSGLTYYGFLVVNEAQAGATTFERNGCNPYCGPGYWDGYRTQLDRAMARVYDHENDIYLADYLIVGLSNDCLHADSFGIPMYESTPCSNYELDNIVQRLIDIGEIAIQAGITPVYLNYPNYHSWDFSLLENLGIPWGMNEQSFNYLKESIDTKIIASLPDAIIVQAWSGNYQRIPGDPVHADKKTVLRASRRIIGAIKRDCAKK